MAFSFNNNDTITLSFTVTMTLNGGQRTMNEREYKAICDQVQSTTTKAFSSNQPFFGQRAASLQQLNPKSAVRSEDFGSKSIAPAIEEKAMVPFEFANPTFHHGSTLQDVGAQSYEHQRTKVDHPVHTSPKNERNMYSNTNRPDLLHRVVSAIGHRKQTFTSAKHRYDVNRMKNVFHSRREMQVSEHRIKSYLMHALSPMEKEVLDATAEYRHIYYKSPEQIILADKRRKIMNRVNHQYNKLMNSMFPGIKKGDITDAWITTNYPQYSHIVPHSQ